MWPLQQRVTSGHLGDPEQFLEELFATRHALLAVSNMAALGHQIYRRMAALARFIPQDCQSLVADLEDQFDRVAGVADGQICYLEGVIEFYKARTDTKVTIAAERLALIAALTLPITALSSGVWDEHHRQQPDRLRPTWPWWWRRWSPSRPSCCAGPSNKDGGSTSPAAGATEAQTPG